MIEISPNTCFSHLKEGPPKPSESPVKEEGNSFALYDAMPGQIKFHFCVTIANSTFKFALPFIACRFAVHSSQVCNAPFRNL